MRNAVTVVGLSSGALTTTVDGVNRVVTFTETAATPGTYAGTVDISALATGSHTVAVSAVDTRGITGNGSAAFTVTAPNTVRVDAISYSTYGGHGGKRNLVLSVHVIDGLNRPISGATVSVMLFWNGFLYGAANALSNSAGNAVFDARNAPAGCYQTAVMAVIAGTWVWDEPTPPNSFCK
jgi:hypothetical protein